MFYGWRHFIKSKYALLKFVSGTKQQSVCFQYGVLENAFTSLSLLGNHLKTLAEYELMAYSARSSTQFYSGAA